MAIASFTQASGLTLSVTITSSRALIPTTGTPTIAVVTNTDNFNFVFVAMGDATVVASNMTSIAIPPKTSVVLTVTGSTYIAGVARFGGVALNCAFGN